MPRTALVTGAASGIGASLVTLLQAEDFDVQRLDLAEGFDVADAEAWERVGAVELAFLNAGVVTGTADIAAVTAAQYERVVGANLDGVVFGVRRLAQVLEPSSAIVATASLAGLVAAPEDPIYTLTKHGVVGFVRAVAPQLAARGVRINAVAPGFVATPLLGASRERFDEAGFPLLDADDVARAALDVARR